MWQAFAGLGLRPALEWAGSQDGEAIIGRTDAGEIVILYHLENPEDAQAIQRAIANDAIPELIADTIGTAWAEAARYSAIDGGN